MADPFEVRMRFTNQLQHLSASAISSQRAASYALKYRDLDEDLHSCILESLERSQLNTRANIMYFLESLLDASTAQQHLGFVRMIKRDILRIIDLVAPDDEAGPGAANVKVVRRVLGNLLNKGYLDQNTVSELEECLRDRDRKDVLDQFDEAGSPGDEKMNEREENGVGVGTKDAVAAGTGVNAAQQQQTQQQDGNGTPTTGRTSRLLDKRQIEQRIEEDRERHKRSRESIWAIDQSVVADPAAELERVWDETSDADDDDYVVSAEMAEERKGRAELHRLEMTS